MIYHCGMKKTEMLCDAGRIVLRCQLEPVCQNLGYRNSCVYVHTHPNPIHSFHSGIPPPISPHLACGSPDPQIYVQCEILI